jgi:hypothetical protein
MRRFKDRGWREAHIRANCSIKKDLAMKVLAYLTISEFLMIQWWWRD